MEILEPAYYRAFRCLAGSCPDSCCKEWDVDVDPHSAAVYHALSGPLGDRLRAVLVDVDGETVMSQSQGRCPMWRQDGLCEIQSQLGEAALCQVCRRFPRLRHDYGNFIELGLELSCPEAARLILTAPAWEAAVRQAPGGDTPEYDMQAMRTLKRTRAQVLSLLESGDLPLEKALAVILLYGYAVQEELDGGPAAVFDPSAELEAAKAFARPGSMQDIINFYKNLEILTPAWRSRLSAPMKQTFWPQPLRRFAQYLIERYWLQSISDYDLVSRVKLVITSCLVVKSLGGDPIQTAQLYSKEIENDPDNIDALLDAAYTSPALSDAALLGLLLTDTIS